MKQITTGYIVTVSGRPMVKRQGPKDKESRLVFGSGKATIFSDRRDAWRIIQRTRRIYAGDHWREIFDEDRVRIIRVVHH